MPDQAGRNYLRGQLKAGGTILIVVVPDHEEVAATYFGAGGEEADRPCLVIEPGLVGESSRIGIRTRTPTMWDMRH
jgi:hypothetical protein